MIQMDRVKEAFRALARGAHPDYVYSCLHRAKLVKQYPNLRRVDVVPDDTVLPPMANIPLKVGAPGVEVTIPPGHYVMVGWEDKRPDRPYATLWTPGNGGTIPSRISILAGLLELGASGGTEAIFKGESHAAAYGSLIDGLAQAFDAIQAVSVGPLSPLKAPVAVAQAALKVFKAQATEQGNFLSKKVKTA